MTVPEEVFVNLIEKLIAAANDLDQGKYQRFVLLRRDAPYTEPSHTLGFDVLGEGVQLDGETMQASYAAAAFMLPPK